MNLYIATIKITQKKVTKTLENYPVILDDSFNLSEFSKARIMRKHFKTNDLCKFEVINYKFSSLICW
jgi:hypothetical protein